MKSLMLALAAAALVKEGIAFGLDYPVDAFDPGMSVRRGRPPSR